MSQLRGANIVEFTYPDDELKLPMDQNQIRYHLSGWLLSQGLSLAKDDQRRGRCGPHSSTRIITDRLRSSGSTHQNGYKAFRLKLNAAINHGKQARA